MELEAWDKEVENAKKIEQEEMGVTFVNVDMTPFRAQVLELHKEMLAKNPNIRDIYEHIQTINARDTGAKE